jgi:DNA polymerase delta subunit 3
MNLLAVCNQEVLSKYASGDPLERWRVYGSIQNPYIKVDNLGPLPQPHTNVHEAENCKGCPCRS